MMIEETRLLKTMFDHIAEVTGYSEQSVETVIGAFVQYVKSSIQNGESIQVTGFGTYSHTDLKERPGRNPRTGESITLPASRRPRFKFSKKFIESVQPDPKVKPKQSDKPQEPQVTNSDPAPPPIPKQFLSPVVEEKIWSAIVDGQVVSVPHKEAAQLDGHIPVWTRGRKGWELKESVPELSAS
jgi:DNA-binding protein HU-beta